VKLPVAPNPSWPATWRDAYGYDLLEFTDAERRPDYTLPYRQRFAATLDLVRLAAPPSARVLDVAAAQGNVTLALAEAGYRVTWNDLRADLAGYVELKHEQGSVSYSPGNIFDLQYDELFDFVLATEVIEHVAHPDAFLAQLAGFVRPGGHAVITTPNGAYFRNRLPKFSECADPSVFEDRQFGPNGTDHIFLLDEAEMCRLAEQAGWIVRTVRLYTSFFLNGHCRTAPLLRMLPQALALGIERALQALPDLCRRRIDVGLAILLRRPSVSC